jgi:very-short-patch-repair endonuclease
VVVPIDLRSPFRGSDAVAAGLVTAKALRGPRFRRLFTGIFVGADVEVDLALRSRAALLLTGGCGVLGGWSAAELLSASCGPEDAPAEVVVVDGGCSSRPDLRVRHDRLPRDEIMVLPDGVAVTTPLRTAYDLARRLPLVDAVVAVDALANVHGVAPAELVPFGYRHLGARGSAQLPTVVALADPRAESPMETRIRFAIRAAGLPAPVLQHPVGPYRLDMAYPAVRLAVEYDGRDHLTPERALRDLDRQACLTRCGWEVLRFRAAEVMLRPWSVAATVRRALER